MSKFTRFEAVNEGKPHVFSIKWIHNDVGDVKFTYLGKRAVADESDVSYFNYLRHVSRFNTDFHYLHWQKAVAIPIIITTPLRTGSDIINSDSRNFLI